MVTTASAVESTKYEEGSPPDSPPSTKRSQTTMVRASIRVLSCAALLLSDAISRACRLCSPIRVIPLPSLPAIPVQGAIQFETHHGLSPVALPKKLAPDPRWDPFVAPPFIAYETRRRSNVLVRSSNQQEDLPPPVVNKEVPEAADAGTDVDADDSHSPALMSSSMIAAIGFYKFWISPLLPPACRFVPTCSIYGIQAIKEFGPYKGAILTAWRILRCSPFGGKGYDPPRWPPVFYTYSSY